jgi:DNA-binding IclR family transcriptional regulator
MPETSKTVTNALRLLACFTREQPSLAVGALSRQLGIPRTNVLRLIATLEHFRLIEREQGCYRLGIRAFELGSLYLTGHPAPSLAVAALDALVATTQCTAYLGVLDASDAVILTSREGSLPVRFIWPAGSRLPCTTTALGKAILMHLPKAARKAHLDPRRTLRTLTANSLRTASALERDLEAAQRRGWAVAREESHAGLTAVGAAILDESRAPVAGISLSYFDHPPDRERLQELGALVRESADRLSTQLRDYRPYGARLVPEFVASAAR